MNKNLAYFHSIFFLILRNQDNPWISEDGIMRCILWENWSSGFPTTRGPTQTGLYSRRRKKTEEGEGLYNPAVQIDCSVFTQLIMPFLWHNEPPHQKTNNLHKQNQNADQLCSICNCTAEQRLCFRYTNSTNPLLLKSIACFCDYTGWFVGPGPKRWLFVFSCRGSTIFLIMP